MTSKACCQCGGRGRLTNLYGYAFCPRCQGTLALHTDKTILKNARAYGESKRISYEDEVGQRLQSMEKEFIKKKVKLLHILERLSELS